MKKILVLLFCGLIGLCACNNSKKNQSASLEPSTEKWILQANTMATLTVPLRIKYIDSLLSSLDDKYHNSNYYNYLKYRCFKANNQTDSAAVYFQKIKPGARNSEWAILINYYSLDKKISENNIVSKELASDVLASIKIAEQNNSNFCYWLYELMAQVYFLNRNTQKSYEYTQLYYENHPFKNSAVVTQRYHDISFLLAETNADTLAMRTHLESAKKLALKNKDSVALLRIIGHEAQWYLYVKKYKKAIESYRQHYDILKKQNDLNHSSINNIAQAFVRSGQADSAIVYYKEALDWAKNNNPKANLFYIYSGLREAYALKNDYKNAYIALDSVLQIHYRNNLKVQADKIEEVHIQYETEKKDNAIKTLQTTNALNNKIITQQWWIFAGLFILLLSAIVLLYNNYKKKILLAKNEKLALENKRLTLEQKIRQIQLNPHFIYNSIANLQGLIANDNKQEANSYLLALSKLMRNILELNRHELISIQDEINALENYIILQQKRFNHTFDYTFNLNTIDSNSFLIPPMLLQPFVENAIEHSLKKMTKNGMLSVAIDTTQEQLHIVVQNNGFNGVEEEKNIKKSLSTTIIQERLDILFNTEKKQAWFTVRPMPETQNYVVELTIPLIKA